MNRKGNLEKTPLLILSALALMGVLLIPGTSESVDLGGGTWEINNRSQNLDVTCPASSTCVEWCMVDGGNVDPSGAFCCVDNSRIPYDRYTDCTAANGGWIF